MATAQRPPRKTKPKAKPETTPAAPVEDASGADAAGAPTEAALVAEATATGELLLNQCSRVRVRMSSFSTTSKVSNEIATEMLKDTDADRKSVSISKRFLNSKHPALEAVRQAKSSLAAYVQSMTIPLLALRNLEDTEAGMQKDAGVRLIQKKDMEEFDRKVEYLVSVLMTATAALQEALPAIKEEEKKRLGRLYSEEDYPQDITKLVAVAWGYETVGVDLDWEKICPAIYQREAANARMKFAAVAENAAEEFAATFVQYVAQVTDQLGSRTRLNPTADSGFLEYKDAEVLELLDHTRDPEIPPGHVLPRVRLKKEGKGRSNDVWFATPLPRNQYQAELRPYETAEKRKLFASTVENLKGQMERFLNVGDMLGPYRSVINESVDRVKLLLTKASGDLDSERIAAELRSGDVFRTEMRAALAGVADQVAAAMSDAKKVRRKISAKLIGKV